MQIKNIHLEYQELLRKQMKAKLMIFLASIKVNLD